MADPNDPAIAAAAEDLGYVARNLRSAGHDPIAAAIDAVAAALLSGADINPDAVITPDVTPLGVAGGEIPQALDETTVAGLLAALGDNAATIQGGTGGAQLPAEALGYAAEAEEFEPVIVPITFDPRPGVDDATVRAALDGALELIGTYRYLVVNAAEGAATIEVFEPGELPLGPGTVPVAGAADIAGQVTNVCAAVPDSDGNVSDIDAAFAAANDVLDALTATAELCGEAPPEAPTAFRVSYRRDGGTLDDASLRPVLDYASRTLSRFGALVPTSITHGPEESLVDYAVLETGDVSTALLSTQLVGWGGTVAVPGVGRVTAAIVS